MIQWEVSRRNKNMTHEQDDSVEGEQERQEQDDSVGGEQVRQEHDT